MRDTLLHTLILSSMYTKFIQDALLYIVFMYIHSVLGSLIMRDTLLHTLILSSMYTKFIQDALLYIVFMYIHSIMY